MCIDKYTEDDYEKLRPLASRIFEVIEKSYLCPESYKIILKDIVNVFADKRLDDLNITEITNRKIDVSASINEFKSTFENPKPTTSDLNEELRYILNTDFFEMGFFPTYNKVIEKCKEFDINLTKKSLKNYYIDKRKIKLKPTIIKKYKSLFKNYFTINNGNNSLDIPLEGTSFKLSEMNLDPSHDNIQDIIEHEIISSETSILSATIPPRIDLRYLIEDNPYFIHRSYNKNFVEYLFQEFYNGNYRNYMEQFIHNINPWALSVITHNDKRRKFLSERNSYLKKLKKQEQYNYIEDVKQNGYDTEELFTGDTETKIAIMRFLRESYENWRHILFIERWDKYWDNRFKEYIKKQRDIAREKFWENEMENNTKIKKTKKQKIAYKIKRKVVLYFANQCELHPEEYFSHIAEKVIKHFGYKFTKDGLRNWLRDNCKYCEELRNETPATMVENITVKIAERWHDNYLEAKGRK